MSAAVFSSASGVIFAGIKHHQAIDCLMGAISCESFFVRCFQKADCTVFQRPLDVLSDRASAAAFCETCFTCAFALSSFHSIVEKETSPCLLKMQPTLPAC